MSNPNIATIGRPSGHGRQKGTPNKLTTTIREALEQAFDEVGGVSYLVRIAEDDPQTFCALLGKCIPKDVKVQHDLAEEWLQRLNETATRIRASLAPSES